MQWPAGTQLPPSPPFQMPISLFFGDSFGTGRLSGKGALCRPLITTTGRLLSNGGALRNNTLSLDRIYSLFSGTHIYFYRGPDSRAACLPVWLEAYRKDRAHGNTELDILRRKKKKKTKPDKGLEASLCLNHTIQHFMLSTASPSQARKTRQLMSCLHPL